MTKPFLLALTLASIIIFALVGRGSMYHFIVVVFMVEFIALPALAIGIIAFALRRKWKFGSSITRISVAFAFVAISTSVSLLPGRILLKHDINSAKQYCEAMIPRIEAFKLVYGAYPISLVEIKDIPLPPRLLSNSRFYQSNGSEYSFSFGDPSGMLNGFAFEGKTQTWSKWD